LKSHRTENEPGNLVANDIMADWVISVPFGASVRSVARLLFDHQIDGAPVVDGAGVAIGMVSDGDLLGRRPDGKRPAWWLELLAHDTPATERSSAVRDRAIQDVMTTPLISVGPYTPVREIARLLRLHRIKRLPVILDAKVIGIVGQADLLDLVEHLPQTASEKAGVTGGLYGLVQSLVGGGSHASGLPPPEASAPAAVAAPDISAESFRNLVTASQQQVSDEAAKLKDVASLERKRQVKAVLEQRVSKEFWQDLVNHAELAAQHGDKEMILLRFPSEVCSDGGRAIDNVEEGWETTLRGEPAEIYARWLHDLKPRGFGLGARIMSFDKDRLGDFGLFLTWTA
jgi:CBS domain-containing protein